MYTQQKGFTYKVVMIHRVSAMMMKRQAAPQNKWTTPMPFFGSVPGTHVGELTAATGIPSQPGEKPRLIKVVEHWNIIVIFKLLLLYYIHHIYFVDVSFRISVPV